VTDAGFDLGCDRVKPDANGEHQNSSGNRQIAHSET